MLRLVQVALAACKVREDKRFAAKAATEAYQKKEAMSVASSSGVVEDLLEKQEEAMGRFGQAHERCMRDCRVIVEELSAEFGSVYNEFISVQQRLATERAEACREVLSDSRCLGTSRAR
jgi:hypothetical protein